MLEHEYDSYIKGAVDSREGERDYSATASRQHLLLHNQGDFWAGVECSQALHQLRMEQLLHQPDLISSCFFVLGPERTVELSSTHMTRLLMGQPEHLAKLPSVEKTIQTVSYIDL